MTGKGSELLSGSKNFYDDLGNEIGSAEFMNGELDKAHCTSFHFGKEETEVIGEDDEAQTITTGYERKSIHLLINQKLIQQIITTSLMIRC